MPGDGGGTPARGPRPALAGVRILDPIRLLEAGDDLDDDPVRQAGLDEAFLELLR